MKLAAIYCRVSTEDQEREGTSLQTQLEVCCQISVTWRKPRTGPVWAIIASAQNAGYPITITRGVNMYEQGMRRNQTQVSTKEQEAWKAGQEAEARAWKVYQEAGMSVLKAFREAIASGWKVGEEAEARATAEKAYHEAIAPATKARDEAIAKATKARDEAVAQATKAHDETVAQAWKAYDKAGDSSK
jgi:hypothetical protein